MGPFHSVMVAQSLSREQWHSNNRSASIFSSLISNAVTGFSAVPGQNPMETSASASL